MHEKYIINLFNNCEVGRLLGIELCDLREGFAKGKLTIKKKHTNIFGTVHGGILFTLADHVGGACGNTLGKKSLLVESAIQYIKAVNEGDTVLAEAAVSHRGKKIGRIDIRIYRENMEIVALMHMIFYIGSDDHCPETD
ncbi:MAG: Acyl-coenzyme A thioesterase PaaI [Syntrophorhabdus sp. PtaU1.Bin153]|nr:MAG: Acyl-coenzyme A thioesterase PaaI [Syntrophorhabdus sp. PtaU1.Bin153]